ncbi:TM0106 family RecB-like putative nuclease [Agromyces mangrovi Wang et al. 2018]|uniref:TM0106 family RecB-like putative nuclease n=1 Tax=Agromyces mangrovi TaxID=1858653 RepID=UPI0025743711|nr:bifunctional RecB family nuclease/DEAD/DEAH box helicase [Agromyces mangrovi]BDZ64182.1 nuclease [Agromyces mangrovi]
MFVRDGRVVTSASDLKKASECEFAFLRALDAKLGRCEPVPDPEDAMLERSARLGDLHEEERLAAYVAEFGDGVAQIARPDTRNADEVQAAVDATNAAFARGADVVFQATFATDEFIGFADFIVRDADGRYLVQDTKLARRAKVTALLQLAAYAEQLDRIGVPRADTAELLLGDGTVSSHRIDDLMPAYRLRLARLRQVIDERLADTEPVAWGDERYAIDGRCPTCDLEVQAHRDVLLVAGMRVGQRARLAAAGIRTIDELAASHGDVEGIGPSVLEGLRAQARLQLEAEADAGEPAPSSTDAGSEASVPDAGPEASAAPPPPPPFHVRDAAALAAIPEPDRGDLFFDFEGDPLYSEGGGPWWGIDYLFGMVDTGEQFTPIWAHTFAEERRALEQFLAFVAERRRRHPGLHIYHYASYERTHLLGMAARHGVGEAAVDQLLREGVFVDLYPVVKRGVRVGSRSYSIKKLEPLYMGDELREAEVKSGGDSILEYVRARDLLAAGEAEAAQVVLDDLADYNRYDCVSTLRLRDWLLERAREEGVAPAPLPDATEATVESSPLAAELLARAGDPLAPGRDPERTALALAAAAIDYHEREQKSFWWAHFFRLEQPIEEWEDTRDVLVVEPAGSVVLRDWFMEDDSRQRKPRRHVLLRGRIAPGSRFSTGAKPFALYEPPGPFGLPGPRPTTRVPLAVGVLEVRDDGVVIEEILRDDTEPWRELPTALAPSPPPNAGAQKGAIAEWARDLVRTLPDWPRNPAADVLRRVPPRTRSGALPASADPVASVTDALLDLDDSYLAVQGPPGTGKTYVGSHVIARLVAEHRWRIGVVAQSHAVVEHLLARIVDAGLDADLVAKAPKDPDAPPPPFTVIAKNGVGEYTRAHAASGYVVGGTAWDFANLGRFDRRSLDLLVIDEAGQFSLASTIAVGVAARNLLLLGDPQQLPQVSQGIHPEPVDGSALGWVADGHDVLPPEFGVFLAESRRMHPAVAAPVSVLSYEGALRSHASAGSRAIEGIEPGLHPVPLEHHGNATESPEEAAEVVRLVASLLERGFTDGAAGGTAARPLAQSDLIVVTPYNAQLALVRGALDAAGYPDVPVGTVDKFQGQEAAVAIVSLAASSAAEVPRGIDFLLLKNRLNVAVSRAKVAAYLVYSPGLLDYLPYTPDGLTQLSGFIRLVGREPAAVEAGNTSQLADVVS